MKIQVIEKDQPTLTGYEPVIIQNGTINLDDYSNNECEDFLLKDSLGYLSFDEVEGVLIKIREKLRRGGTVKLSGIEPRILARKFIDGIVSDDEYNKIVYTYKSLVSLPTMRAIVSSIGLTVQTVTIKGINYEFDASR